MVLASSPGCLEGEEKKWPGTHYLCMRQSVPKILAHLKLVHKLLCIQLLNVQLVHVHVYSQTKGVYVEHVAVRVHCTGTYTKGVRKYLMHGRQCVPGRCFSSPSTSKRPGDEAKVVCVCWVMWHVLTGEREWAWGFAHEHNWNKLHAWLTSSKTIAW